MLGEPPCTQCSAASCSPSLQWERPFGWCEGLGGVLCGSSRCEGLGGVPVGPVAVVKVGCCVGPVAVVRVGCLCVRSLSPGSSRLGGSPPVSVPLHTASAAVLSVKLSRCLLPAKSDRQREIVFQMGGAGGGVVTGPSCQRPPAGRPWLGLVAFIE